jgi:uroporphyrinogen decarboxylase
VEVRIADVSQQLAVVDDDVLERLGIDVRGVEPRGPRGWSREIVEERGELAFVDERGVRRRMPAGGLYYDPATAPLAGEIDGSHLARFAWPDGGDPARRAGVAAAAHRIVAEEGRGVFVGSVCAGLTEMLFRLRGFEDGYMDLAADHALARALMERVLEVKLAWWGGVLPELGDAVDVVGEADDLGGQATPLFDPRTYRSLVKPLHAELFAFIRARTRARVLFHSCGAIRELLPDLVEIGVDVLNPVQVSAAGMATAELKRELGRDLVFWGGGVDTQRVLGAGTPAEVRAEVARRIDDLAPGGGFVFASVHNIQANVPAENLAALWRTVEERGGYAGAVASGAQGGSA